MLELSWSILAGLVCIDGRLELSGPGLVAYAEDSWLACYLVVALVSSILRLGLSHTATLAK